MVVGNPPYITVKDKKLNELYRELYNACGGTYALSVPFAQRFFELAKRGETDGNGYGMVGQITANSFMKREFGTKLIEEYFAHKVELTEVIDTSGAYIPGHGTPTVILVGRPTGRIEAPADDPDGAERTGGALGAGEGGGRAGLAGDRRADRPARERRPMDVGR